MISQITSEFKIIYLLVFILEKSLDHFKSIIKSVEVTDILVFQNLYEIFVMEMNYRYPILVIFLNFNLFFFFFLMKNA